MELTKDEAIRLHRELWDWLSKNPLKRKDQWPGWEGYEIDNPAEFAYCFACWHDGQYPIDDTCEKCLLEFIPNEFMPGSHFYCLGGLFEDWQNAKRDKRVRIAEQIRDLPVRNEPLEGVQG